MAFTGTQVIQIIADGIARVTGLSLAAGATGTIGMNGGSGQISLPADFHANQYSGPVQGVIIPTQASIDVTVKFADLTTPPGDDVRVTKQGNAIVDFLAVFTNLNLASASPALEIYLKFHT